jgi:hypothetical protein
MLVICERGEREGVNIKPKSRIDSTDETPAPFRYRL